MKIKELSVKNFTVFEDAKFEFSSGLNVLIGENGTGKSHAIKLMYALLKGDGDGDDEDDGTDPTCGRAALGRRRKLSRVFRPDDGKVLRLVRRHGKTAPADVQLELVEGKQQLSLRVQIDRGVSVGTGDTVGPAMTTPDCLFIPAPDVLALYEGFIGSYAKRELSLDETFNDICVALNANELREEPDWAVDLLRRLEKLIGGKVKLKGDRFYVGPLEAHLVAAGHRKLAEIVRLIANGSIAVRTVLFWDEPEAGMNPRLITTISEVAFQLAAADVQVFIATHDFLLTDQLSLAAEYQTEEGKAARPRFFGLSRPKPATGVEVEWGDGLAAIRKNSILDEYAAQQERERELFYGDTAAKGST